MLLFYLKMITTKECHWKIRLLFLSAIWLPQDQLWTWMICEIKNYMLKVILLHPNVARNARVVLKLCLLLNTTLAIHWKHGTYMNILNHRIKISAFTLKLFSSDCKITITFHLNYISIDNYNPLDLNYYFFKCSGQLRVSKPFLWKKFS